jgi:hypothetical protein
VNLIKQPNGGLNSRHFLLAGLWKRGIITGTAAGIVLGMLLKAVQQFTGHRVYTLLLNVDFIDGMPSDLSEFTEFCLHLMVSVPLGVLYCYACRRWNRPRMLAVLFSLVPAASWVPLTQLSPRVPAVGEWQGLTWWLAGHAVYGLVLFAIGSSKKEVKDVSTDLYR